MDSPDPAKTQSSSEQPPAAIIQPGNPAERPAGMVSAEELNMDIDAMLDRPGFAAFLEHYDDADMLEMTEENREEIARRFQAFDASKTVARQFEHAMNQKLQREGRKDRMNAEERQAYRDHVAEIAARNPDELIDLQEDLRALEENPERIRQKEAELAELKGESLNLEKIRAGTAELTGKKMAIEQSFKDAEKVKFSGWQKFLGQFGRGKQAGLERQKTEWDIEHRDVAAALREAEELLKNTPEIIAAHKDSIRKTTDRLSDAQERIFGQCAAAKQIRGRLISETRERCEKSLQSMDISTLQKAAEQFTADEKLAEAGSDYFGLETDPGFAERHKQKLHEQMEKAIAVGIFRALESLPAGATQSRLERALRAFTRLAETEIGTAEKGQTKEFVLETLRQAEEDARIKSKGSGRRFLLERVIQKLERKEKKTGTATA